MINGPKPTTTVLHSAQEFLRRRFPDSSLKLSQSDYKHVVEKLIIWVQELIIKTMCLKQFAQLLNGQGMWCYTLSYIVQRQQIQSYSHFIYEPTEGEFIHDPNSIPERQRKILVRIKLGMYMRKLDILRQLKKKIDDFRSKNVWEILEKFLWMNVLLSTLAFLCKRYPDSSISKLREETGKFKVLDIF